MSIQDRFCAAVNVINSLPKHGPYQPSNEMKLSFYAYYKQATEGPNMDTKPWSWEVIKKAKWDAWKRLGDMTKEIAMTKYVEELNKIVETMSYTENVADFLKSMDDSSEDKEGAVSECRALALPAVETEEPILSETTIKQESTEEDEEELYTDSLDSTVNQSIASEATLVIANGHTTQESPSEHQASTTDVLMRTVLTLRTELNEITALVRKIEQKQKSFSRRGGLFKGFSSQTIAFMILWPVITNIFLMWLFKRRRFIKTRY